MCCNKHTHSLTSKPTLECEETSSARIKLAENHARDTITSLKKLGMYSFETESDTHLSYL